MRQENNGDWEVAETVAKLETEVLKPGESATYKVVLDWLGGESNVGVKENTAEITGTENEAGFEETNLNDNKDKADLVVAVGTGEITYVIGAGIVIITLAVIAIGLRIQKRKED